MPDRLSPVLPRVPAVDKRSVFAQQELFADIDPRELEKLAAYARPQHFRRGQTIFRKGDPGHSMMAVLTGTVKMVVPSSNGRELVLNLIHAGEAFGELALLDGRDRSTDAVAVTDADVLVLERREFVPFLLSHPPVALKLLEVLAHKVRRTSEQVEDVVFLDLPARLAKTLLRLASNGHDPARRGAVVSITQKSLGQMVGTSRESVNKQLQTWESRNWIAVAKGTVTLLEVDAMSELTAAENDSDEL